MPSHTTPSLYVMPVFSPPIYLTFFSARATPFRSDASPWWLYLLILICDAPWCMSLLCAALSCSSPLCDSSHLSLLPVPICASEFCSFRICAALCHSATPKDDMIILRNWSSMTKSQMNTAKAGILYSTVRTHTSAHLSTSYYTP